MLSEVDTKFSKFVDKECDVINGEVKKWFKKLSVCRSALSCSLCGADVSMQKEEKAHDERIANANAKIKQAGMSPSREIIVHAPMPVPGQLYEKRAKRNAIDAAEEHNRYINLLNTLGPEISQTK